MKVLVLGADGMVGHQVLRSFAERFEVVGTTRDPAPLNSLREIAARNNFELIGGLAAGNYSALAEILATKAPDVVVNAIGIVKQRSAAAEYIPSLEVNALFPHRLAQLVRLAKSRLIHISTDCVFSGARGDYSEADPPDATDLYGRTKALGEVSGPGSLTIRTSVIGLELKNYASLIEWFLKQRHSVRGFTRAIFSGVTTAELARVLAYVVENRPGLNGIWHVASEPISKYELLKRLTVLLQLRELKIEPDTEFFCDRSLRGTAFAAASGYSVSSWETMLVELAAQIREERAV